MSSLTDGLNKEQASAVLSEAKRILMLAGAGTGKTRTLTHRLAHLNLNCRIGTSSIIAITFTRAAAKEMKDRLIPLIGEGESRKLVCCTFHALAVRILQEWSQRLGLDKQFTIYSQEDREEVLKTILSKLGLQTTLNKVLEKKDRLSMSEEAKAWREYQWQLKRFNAVDLDDLIPKVNYLFVRYPDVAEYYRRQWKYLLVDEMQDTDVEQLQFIKLFNPENLFVIGDDYQCVYGWRGARVENILEFPNEFPGTEVIKLEQNYRSTVPIIEAANNLISHNVNQTEKSLFANRDGVPLLIIDGTDAEDEANGISVFIKNKSLDDRFSDFAVLARTNAQVEHIYWKLKGEGIPCMILSNSDDPLKKPDIKSLIAYLDCIFNPKDETNYKRVLRFPEPIMTDLEFQELEQIAIDKSISLREALSYSENRKILKFHYLFNDLVDRIYLNHSIWDAFNELIHYLKLRDHYIERSLNNRNEDLDQALQYIFYWVERQQRNGEDCTAPAFLKWMKIRDIQEKLMEERDCVKLMTVHGSKGLEFDTVFLIGMNDGVFPSHNSRDMEEERRLAYVAVTRAKRNLIISSTKKYVSAWGKEQEMQPSRFIQELREKVSN